MISKVNPRARGLLVQRLTLESSFAGVRISSLDSVFENKLGAGSGIAKISKGASQEVTVRTHEIRPVQEGEPRDDDSLFLYESALNLRISKRNSSPCWLQSEVDHTIYWISLDVRPCLSWLLLKQRATGHGCLLFPSHLLFIYLISLQFISLLQYIIQDRSVRIASSSHVGVPTRNRR